ncbi:AT-rich interactive domain-containing protein 1A-like isoform X10 [Zerene cesonia]|uniref:AT-rich interactive domain-containing protein 1A-like isoform X10 n=1 Tax=Zerene cesonia TaxID=33412 RepID=UPI0018E54114|nr:AT-rich interactive domain-containing protein 1A-like isoform X10 [Zerene cesonia]
MATGPKIVHKQFNSPIGLYSQQNIQETLNKHLQNLDNGTVGIDFHNPTTEKPANLANSAVLRMLEEEERNRKGYPKLDPTQVQAILQNLERVKHRFDNFWPPRNQKKVVWPPAPETNGYHQAQQPTNQKPQFSPQSQYSPQPQYSEPAYQPPQKHFEPPPATITLRPQPPIHQSPSPVFASQPAAASFQGGVNMRGDTKWPPQSVKEAVAAENEARRQLAKGPACRPRKVQKDYSSFFSQHALNHSYTSYRVPPGTQHYEDHSGRSSY